MQYAVRLLRTLGWVEAVLLVLLSGLNIGCGGQGAPALSHHLLYIANLEPNTISAYRINADGSLAPVPGSPFALGGNTLVARSDGDVLFSVGSEQGSIQLNSDNIARDGSLSASFTITDNTLAGVRAANPDGTALYVSSQNAAEGNWGWKIYSISPAGILAFAGGVIDQSAGRLAFSPDGSTAYAAYCSHLLPNIEQFTVAASGMLSGTNRQIATAVPYGACPNTVAVAPAGNMLAAPWSDATSSGPADSFITLFGIDPSTHALTPAAGSMFPASGAANDAIFDPSGKFLVTAQNNGIGVYQVGQNTLAELSSSPVGSTGIDRVMFTPSANFLTAISRASGQIFVFSFDPSTGALTMTPSSPVSTASPYDMAVVDR